MTLNNNPKIQFVPRKGFGSAAVIRLYTLSINPLYYQLIRTLFEAHIEYEVLYSVSRINRVFCCTIEFV